MTATSDRGLKPEVLGPKYAVRLGDLKEWHVLVVTCWRCGHIGRIYPSRLKRRHTDHERLMDLEAKLKCHECENRHGNSWQVFRIPRD